MTTPNGILAAKKNLRLLVAGGLPDPLAPTLTYRSVAGGFLVQTRDNGRVTAAELKVVTKRQPPSRKSPTCCWPSPSASMLKSNAIIYVKDGSTAGIGAGQNEPRWIARASPPSRPRMRPRSRAGLETAHDRFSGGFRSLLPLPRRSFGCRAKRGATAVIQPGGSMNDQKVIDAADEAGSGHGFHRHAPLPPLAAREPVEHFVGVLRPRFCSWRSSHRRLRHGPGGRLACRRATARWRPDRPAPPPCRHRIPRAASPVPCR